MANEFVKGDIEYGNFIMQILHNLENSLNKSIQKINPETIYSKVTGSAPKYKYNTSQVKMELRMMQFGPWYVEFGLILTERSDYRLFKMDKNKFSFMILALSSPSPQVDDKGNLYIETKVNEYSGMNKEIVSKFWNKNSKKYTNLLELASDIEKSILMFLKK